MSNTNIIDTSAPLVAIRCITYNHESYIRDALRGFVMQKTSFPFVAIVHDDASTDGTAKIIEEYAEKYPDIIKPIFEKENQYSKRNGSITRIMNAAVESTGAKYIAFCEGDDYWIDPLKLQKQVDFLENNPDYSMACGKVKRLNQMTGLFIDEWGNEVENFDKLLLGNCISTPTTMIRTEYYNKYYDEINPSKRGWKLGDFPIWLYMAGIGKLMFDKEITTVYRIIPNSASHFNDYLSKLKFMLSISDIQTVFCEFFHAKPKLKHLIQIRRHIIQIQQAVIENDKLLKEKYRRLLTKNILNRFTSNRLRLKMFLLILFPSFATSILKKRSMS